MPEPRTLTTDDGLLLEAELAVAVGPERAAMVLCHPHPQFGGSMRSLVISTLFDALPAAGVTCLRFNFRGVERSEGIYDNGRAEQRDAGVAFETLAHAVPASRPVAMAGWSFGADMALSVRAPRVAGWLAIACPLRFTDALDDLGRDPRPKTIVLAGRDELVDSAAVAARARDWARTRVIEVAGASHFFIGRTDRVVQAATGFVDDLTLGETAPGDTTPRETTLRDTLPRDTLLADGGPDDRAAERETGDAPRRGRRR